MSGASLRRAAALMATLAVVLAACLTDAPVPSDEPTPTPEPEATATVTVYGLNTTVWYGGFEITLGRATATIDAKGGPVAVVATLANPSDVDATLDGPIVLASAGTVVEPTRETVLPLVPAGGTATSLVTFETGPDFDLSMATITVGRPMEHQAIVPLVAGAAEEVTLEPLVTEVAVNGQAGSLFVELHQSELRADLPDWNQELAPGLMALTLTYDATFRSDFVGGFAFTAANVALRLPDGTLVAPRRDGHSQSVVVLAAGNREVSLRSRFEVPAQGDGTYAFVITDAAKTTDIPFVVALP